MNPCTTVLAFALILIILDFIKPQVTRIITGIFFLLMGLGVNVTILLTDPTSYIAAGKDALLPVYRWFFTTVIAAFPIPLIVALIIFETAVGISILSKGRYVRYGLIGAVVFCLWLTPVGIHEITTPALALAFGLLLRNNFDQSLIDLIGRLFHRRSSVAAV